MEDKGTTESFSAEEICNQARDNLTAMSLVLVAYARDRDEEPAAMARFVGQRFTPSWPDEAQGEALAVVRAAALNMVSGGAELRRLDGDAARAAATVAGWPDPEDLAFFGLSQDDADAFFDVFAPIAEHLGLRYAWRRDGDAVTMTFAREATDP